VISTVDFTAFGFLFFLVAFDVTKTESLHVPVLSNARTWVAVAAHRVRDERATDTRTVEPFGMVLSTDASAARIVIVFLIACKALSMTWH
jgi:hypothetical protein